MKTPELSGAALDWAVANCEGLVSIDTKNLFEPWYLLRDYIPSTNWAQGGPIIEREGFQVLHVQGGDNPVWKVESPRAIRQYGPTPLIAAMRCYVASKLGEEVEIPEEVSNADI